MGVARSREARQAAWKRGRWAERMASWLLRLKGYRIVARDFRTPVGEVDLIARRGHILALIEVKRRATLAEAADAIGFRQRQRIARAAEAFRQRRPDLAHLQPRFDALLLTPGRWPRHIIDAWRDADGTAKR